MGKRRRRSDSDDSDYDDLDYSNSSTRAKHRQVKSKNPAQKKTKSTTAASATETDASPAPRHAKSLHIIDVPTSFGIQSSLVEWFDDVRDSRGMPWRKPFDEKLGREERAQRAYEVWVSEIMLQQTQVATVIPYYNKWMAKFPTIRQLAAASIEDVNALWKGLGYYSRASRLLAGAQKVVKDYKGMLPDNAKDMEANIPGIGRYSAGAICSIAYGERVPVLDGNVHRLLSRLLALHASPKAKPTLDILWAAAEALVQDAGSVDKSPYFAKEKSTSYHPGDINQALIELGSTVCKVRDPLCSECPLRSRCHAYTFSTKSDHSPDVPDIEDACSLCEPLPEGSQVTAYPMKAERKKAREEMDLVNVVEWRSVDNPEDRRFLLVKRPEKGLLAGLYEFITTPNISTTAKRELLKLTSTQLSSLFGDSFGILDFESIQSQKEQAHDNSCHVADVVSVGDVLHVFSHIKKTYRTQWVVLQGGSSPPAFASSPAANVSGQKRTSKKRADTENSNVFQQAMWATLTEVPKANIGTGVGKVWSLVEAHWKNNILQH
ncbi:hypothetical protein VKT23_012813 [Stygiomarasmius scandens]|uniref:Adenine DNA glycosylase n=1 Tax=Marasmiellus scandens TaxID=2682957 RepID=A0ABR1J7Y4_9AGAR